LDLNMPELDGVTVLRQKRNVDLKQPVIILTGDSTPETERQVRALGVSGVILKGASLHLLADILKRLLKTPASLKREHRPHASHVFRIRAPALAPSFGSLLQ